MTARDRWTEKLKCPICGIEGTARLSQADGWAFERDQSTRVDECPPGFRTQAHETLPDQVRFFCMKDGIPVDR